MPTITPELSEAFDRTRRAAQVFSQSPLPNSNFEEFDHISKRLAVENLIKLVDLNSAEYLIQHVDNILTHLDFPEIDYSTASLSLVKAKSQGQDLALDLRRFKDLATSAGFVDPSKSDLDLTSQLARDRIQDIDGKLSIVLKLLESLRREIKESIDGKTGYSISIGPVSIELDTVLKLLKSLNEQTREAREYISEKIRINSLVLEGKLKVVSDSSVSLKNAVKKSVGVFTKKAFDISLDAAHAAAQAYETSLVFIRAALDTSAEKESEESPGLFLEINKVVSIIGNGISETKIHKALTIINSVFRRDEEDINKIANLYAGAEIDVRLSTFGGAYQLEMAFPIMHGSKFANLTMFLEKSDFIFLDRLPAPKVEYMCAYYFVLFIGYSGVYPFYPRKKARF